MTEFDSAGIRSALVRLPGFGELQRLVCNHGQSAWLVGGCLRDFCLDRPLTDIDVALTGDCGVLAQQLARRTGGRWFWLNRVRGQARVVYHGRDSCGPITYDLVPLQGGNLMTDLGERDFTINAMALPLTNDQGLFDPFAGLRDLAARRLRTTSPEVVARDPVRVLRGVRFRHLLHLHFDPLTWELLKRSAPALAEVPGERLSLEWARIFSQPATSELAEEIGQLRLRNWIMPSDAMDKTDLPADLVRLERLLVEHEGIGRLGERMVGSGFSAAALIRLGLLFQVDSPEAGRHLADRLRLSGVCRNVLTAMAPAGPVAVPTAPSERAQALWLHRLPGGLPCGLLILLARSDRSVPALAIEKLCETVLALLRYGPPEPMLPTERVVALTGVAAGPELGSLLNRLVDAEITGQVVCAEDAENWLKKQFGNFIDKGETDA